MSLVVILIVLFILFGGGGFFYGRGGYGNNLPEWGGHLLYVLAFIVLVIFLVNLLVGYGDHGRIVP